jgi:creatinine deaminase
MLNYKEYFKMTRKFMAMAIAEAAKSANEHGIPIGAVLVRNGEVLGRGHNQRVQKRNPILHAEIDCLQNAGRIGRYGDAVLYSTLMPCYLCAGAVVQFGIRHVVVGEAENFAGAADFLREHGVDVEVVDDPACIKLLGDFISAHGELWNEDIGELDNVPTV